MTAFDTFFQAWSVTDPGARAAALGGCLADNAKYSDPRSGGTLEGPTAIDTYVGMFAANAPGWTAKVEASADVNGYHRLRVAFGGQGPDGADMVQHGTYFGILDDAGMISLLAGFVGAEA